MQVVFGGVEDGRLGEHQRICSAGHRPSAAASESLPSPTNALDLAAHYDLALSHPKVDEISFRAFDRLLARACADRGLACLLVHDGNVHEVIQRVATGRVTIGYHLDYFALWHTDDPYARLTTAVQDAGGRPVNPPARARAFTDKASAHGELLRNNLGVPATVVLRPWFAERPLTEKERAHLRLDETGACVYVKPANGFSMHGIVRIEDVRPDSLTEKIITARKYDPRDSYLIQREERFADLICEDGTARPAYWRVVGCLGELTAFWWSPWDAARPQRASYRAVTQAEIRRHRLGPVLEYAETLGALSGLDWFSTELCLSNGPATSRFLVNGADGRERPVLAIDYINDQCDVDVQSRWAGAPPDRYVERVAERFAEEAWRLRQSRLRPAAPVYLRAA
jgi:hypothetical protein